jgi:hypothetical protein
LPELIGGIRDAPASGMGVAIGSPPIGMDIGLAAAAVGCAAALLRSFALGCAFASCFFAACFAAIAMPGMFIGIGWAVTVTEMPPSMAAKVRKIIAPAYNAARASAPIHKAIPTIIKFSSSDTKPSGTLLDPPTQAHLSSRLST